MNKLILVIAILSFLTFIPWSFNVKACEARKLHRITFYSTVEYQLYR